MTATSAPHWVTSEPETNWLNAEEQEIWRAYLTGTARIAEVLDAELRPHGLDLGEYEILVALSEAPGRRLRMSDLAEVVHQSRSRLTHAIARMEEKGLVGREQCPDDRRGVFAALTDTGYSLLVAAAPAHVESVRRVFVDAVSADDYKAIGRAMRDVLEKSATA